MNSRDLAREIVDGLRSDEITPAVAKEIGRRIAASAADDPFDFARYVTKLLLRHARRAGRKRHRAPSPYKLKIARAAVWARWNQGVGKEEAAAQAAQAEGVPQQRVFRAAFELKDPAMTALIRELSGTPVLIKRG